MTVSATSRSGPVLAMTTSSKPIPFPARDPFTRAAQVVLAAFRVFGSEPALDLVDRHVQADDGDSHRQDASERLDLPGLADRGGDHEEPDPDLEVVAHDVGKVAQLDGTQLVALGSRRPCRTRPASPCRWRRTALPLEEVGDLAGQ